MRRIRPPGPAERALRRALAELRFYGHILRTLVGPTLRLALVVLVGAVLERFFGAPPNTPQLSWGQAFYASYCLLYLEHVGPLPAHPIGQAVQYVQPLLGILLLAEGFVKIMVASISRGEKSEVWVKILASTARGHTIVIGVGSVGFRVIEELHRMGEQVFAVERSEDGEFLPAARELGVQILVGDARQDSVLRSLNVPQARAVIVATDDDLVNLEVAMDVRELTPEVPVVLRLFDQRLARKVRASLGVEVSFSTSALAAPLFASAALDPRVVGTHRVEDRYLLIVELVLTPGCRLDGASAADLSQLYGLTLLAQAAPDQPWQLQPPPMARVRGGDRVRVALQRKQLDQLADLADRPVEARR